MNKKLSINLMLIVAMVLTIIFPYGSQKAEAAVSNDTLTFEDGTEVKVTENESTWFIKVFVDGELDQDLQVEKNDTTITGTSNGGQNSVNIDSTIFYEDGGSGGSTTVTDPFHFVDSKYSDAWERSGTLYNQKEIQYGEVHQLTFGKGTLIGAVIGTLLGLPLMASFLTVTAALELAYSFVVGGVFAGVLTDYIAGTTFAKIYRSIHTVYSDGFLGYEGVDEKYYADVNRDTPEPDSYTKYLGSDGFFRSNDEMLDIGIYNGHLYDN